MGDKLNLNRRTFLIAAPISMVMLPTAAHAQGSPRNEIGVFQQLADGLWNFLQSGMRLARIPNRRRLVRFLSGFHGPLTHLRNDKYALWVALDRANCSGPGGAMAVRDIARRIIVRLDALRVQSNILASAIRPAALQDDFTAFASGLGLIDAEKLWLGRLPTSCPIPENRRLQLRSQVEQSLNAVRQCQVSLGRIIQGLERS